MKIKEIKLSFFYLLLCGIILSCNTSKKSIAEKKSLSGLYCTEKMPADIGEPYRTYLKFFKEGTVLKLSSPLSCDSVDLIINKQYSLKTSYTISNNELSFTFEGISATKNQYIEAYTGKILNKQLDLIRGLKYDDDKSFTRFNEEYHFCN